MLHLHRFHGCGGTPASTACQPAALPRLSASTTQYHPPATRVPNSCQGGGVFCNPTSPTAPAKLRCLYETFPLALIAEAAGGATHDGCGSGGRQSMQAW